ncbi:MAG: pitrilysin family protein [Bacteroidales bacterium]|nr:pitrilysin family protein [Bacteroidales bacterium]
MKKTIVLLFTIFALFQWALGQQNPELTIEFEKYTLPNGLDVILHIDRSDPIVALAIRFHVGSNRESEGHTGFAHLFEHMMFQRSENVGEDQFFKIIQDAGGTLNGGTSNDATTYYEVVPKNALEKILWMESDRMGYMINTVTENAFNIQQNVVQNEKRQSYDNQPYGFTSWVIATNLYPKGHPYSWTVIGEMDDLKSATIDDVKAFHNKYYLPNNATLVLAGDFDVKVAKKLIEKYFGEIKRGDEIVDPKPIPVTLEQTKKVYHEDNFAKVPQIRMIWPTVEAYNDDSYPLEYLAQLLSKGKKAPLYKILEKEKKMSSSQYAYNGSQEIAGAFVISATANDGVSLDDMEKGVSEALTMFETAGFTDEDVERIKASQETDFYNGISSILGKSYQLASYNEDKGDPAYYKVDIARLKSVTKSDILRVYGKYIKNKPYLVTSFVPKGQLNLIVEGSEKAAVKEESIVDAAQVEISEKAAEEISKTPTLIDRSVMPADGPDPSLILPVVWNSRLSNGMQVFGIEHNELPLVQFSLEIKGGHLLDPIQKPGLANLVCELMMEGTKNKTPLALEEEIERLGASINIRVTNNSIIFSANTLTRNYDQVLALAKEILLEPRWDETEFSLAKTRILNMIKRQKANPATLARNEFNELIYGRDHIFAYDRNGTEESVAAMTMDDLKSFYAKAFSPSVTSFQVAGSITRDKVLYSLKPLASEWQVKEVVFPAYTIPAPLKQSKIIFVDVPGAKQSVINIGCLGLARQDKDFFPATVMNYKLGGSFSGIVNLVLREEKGFTYGARTNFSEGVIPGTFMASANVRSSSTEESVVIFKDLMTRYVEEVSMEDLEFTRNSLIKGYARQFETLRAKIGMLSDISMYNLPVDYVKGEQAIVQNMTLGQLKALAQKYINPSKMYYVVAGDAKTQLEPLEKIGFGKPRLVEKK